MVQAFALSDLAATADQAVVERLLKVEHPCQCRQPGLVVLDGLCRLYGAARMTTRVPGSSSIAKRCEDAER